MATDGMWTMTDEGEFVLAEPYASQLKEARLIATTAWTNALVGYLAERSPYSAEELANSLIERSQEGATPDEIVNEFVLEALGGDL